MTVNDPRPRLMAKRVLREWKRFDPAFLFDQSEEALKREASDRCSDPIGRARGREAGAEEAVERNEREASGPARDAASPR